MVIPIFMQQLADFLNIIIFQSDFIFFNFWSILHFTAGFLVVKYYLKSGDLHRLFFLLVVYEMFELAVISLGLGWFRAEVPKDIMWDLIVGLVGGYIAVKTL